MSRRRRRYSVFIAVAWRGDGEDDVVFALLARDRKEAVFLVDDTLSRDLQMPGLCCNHIALVAENYCTSVSGEKFLIGPAFQVVCNLEDFKTQWVRYSKEKRWHRSK